MSETKNTAPEWEHTCLSADGGFIRGKMLPRSVEKCVRCGASKESEPQKDDPWREGAICIVFDGPPSHESGRFVEVETPSGKGVAIGNWEEHETAGLWSLTIQAPAKQMDPQEKRDGSVWWCPRCQNLVPAGCLDSMGRHPPCVTDGGPGDSAVEYVRAADLTALPPGCAERIEDLKEIALHAAQTGHVCMIQGDRWACGEAIPTKAGVAPLPEDPPAFDAWAIREKDERFSAWLALVMGLVCSIAAEDGERQSLEQAFKRDLDNDPALREALRRLGESEKRDERRIESLLITTQGRVDEQEKNATHRAEITTLKAEVARVRKLYQQEVRDLGRLEARLTANMGATFEPLPDAPKNHAGSLAWQRHAAHLRTIAEEQQWEIKRLAFVIAVKNGDFDESQEALAAERKRWEEVEAVAAGQVEVNLKLEAELAEVRGSSDGLWRIAMIAENDAALAAQKEAEELATAAGLESIEQQERAQDAEAKLREYEDDTARALTPHPDEEHCACAPLLRVKLREVEEERDGFKEESEHLNGETLGAIDDMEKAQVKLLNAETERDVNVAEAQRIADRGIELADTKARALGERVRVLEGPCSHCGCSEENMIALRKQKARAQAEEEPVDDGMERPPHVGDCTPDGCAIGCATNHPRKAEEPDGEPTAEEPLVIEKLALAIREAGRRVPLGGSISVRGDAPISGMNLAEHFARAVEDWGSDRDLLTRFYDGDPNEERVGTIDKDDSNYWNCHCKSKRARRHSMKLTLACRPCNTRRPTTEDENHE